MSVDQATPRGSPRSANDVKFVRYEDYIENKIQSTRRAVKLVDLTTSLVALGAGVLAYLLLVAVADHWIVPGGFNVVARVALFAVLLGGVGYFVVRNLWPLVVRSINPVYAAHAIEEGSPTLKNSLINLLLFRQRKTDISEAVYRTLEEQAAQRLTRVPVDTAIDRSMLIRLGYLLIAVVAVAGLYKVFSPKDPIVAARRVLMPWADIVPASRVAINAVSPGSITVSRGEFVDVSAEVRGIGDDDAVMLRYTTDDGQVVGKPIPMKPAGDGLRFRCRVADEADGAQDVGLTRNLTYRLEAGDARSLDYAITVVEAPSILVERVDYHYPPYTGQVDRSVNELGDIRAIEGTRVTVHARANGPIRQADVDFDADGRRDLRMTATGPGAKTPFELALREPERQTPRHASYVLRFTNEEGRSNRDPVKHSIIVERDNDPEASIIAPKEKSIDVRLDETVTIEVDAIDPDFKLSSVRLRADVGEAKLLVLNEPLLKSEHRGRFSSRYSFTPNKHRLKAGDVVDYWVEAADNRTPKANQTASVHKKLRIVSPDPAKQPPPDRIARNDRQQPKQDQQPEQGEQQNKGQQDQQNEGGAKQDGNAENRDGGKQSGQPNAGNNQQKQNGDKQDGAKSDSEGAKEQQPQNGPQRRQGEAPKNDQSNEKNNNESKPGEKGQPGQQSKSDKGSSDGQKSSDEQTGAGASGGQQSKDAERPDGARPDQKQDGEQGRGGERAKSDAQAKPGDEQKPVSSEGDNDGEAFERIQQHMERSGELKEGEDVSRDAQRSAEQVKGDKEKVRQGEKQNSRNESTENKGDGESAGASGSDDGKQKQNEGKQNEGKQSDSKQNAEQNKQGGDPNSRNEQQQPGDESKAGSEKQDAKSRDANQPEQKGAGEKSNQEKSPDGQEAKTKGPAGAGEEQESKGSPQSGRDQKPTDKREQQGSKGETNKQEPPSGGQGKRESDSQGDQGGDKSGGGEEGAGQKAPREGTGSAGQNQSADEGAGESGEKGKGNASQSGGKDAKSDQKTGSSGGEMGEGSQKKDGTGSKSGGKAGGEDAKAGDQSGNEKSGAAGEKKGDEKKSANEQQSKSTNEPGKHGEKQNAKQNPQQGNEPGKNGKSSDAANKDASGNTPGGSEGQPGVGGNPQPSITGEAPEGDEANLEYARKQTDLVLEKLSDQMQKNKVDDKLLKELGWSREDMRRFVERWKQRKEAADRGDPSGEAAKRELDDALRSLGLRKAALQQNAVKKDSMRNLNEGYRGQVPLEYQERLRAYNQGVSRAEQDTE